MNTNNNGTAKETTVNVMEICLLCGGRKQEKYPVCSNCYKDYIKAGKGWFLTTGSDLPFPEWLLQQAENALPKIEQEYTETKAAVDALREKSNQVRDKLERTELQAYLSDGEFNELITARRKKLWEDGNGNKLFGDMKRWETCSELLPDLITKLKDELQSDANKTQQIEPAATVA